VELLLNAVWLVIALGSVCVWRGAWRRDRAPSRREWVALATLLFLLFPVISLTDDLHEELAVAECSTGTKHFLTSASKAVSHQNARQSSTTHLGATWNPGIPAPVSEGVLLRIQEAIEVASPALRVLSDRAPPNLRS